LRKIGNAVLRGEDPAQWEWMLQPDMADTLVTLAKPGADIVDVFRGVSKKEGISDPYAFLAACVELAQALEVGPSFKNQITPCVRRHVLWVAAYLRDDARPRGSAS